MSRGYSEKFSQRQRKIQLSRDNLGKQNLIIYWVRFKPPVLKYSEVGTYVYKSYVYKYISLCVLFPSSLCILSIIQLKSPSICITQTNITTAMGLPGLTELALTVLLGRTFLLLMGLLARKELALTGLLGGTLLSQMGLLGRTELVLTTLNMDLLKETGLRTGTVRGNVGKSSKFKLKSVEHTVFL